MLRLYFGVGLALLLIGGLSLIDWKSTEDHAQVVSSRDSGGRIKARMAIGVVRKTESGSTLGQGEQLPAQLASGGPRQLSEVVDSLKSLSRSYSDLELRQKQLDLLSELASTNALSTSDLMLLIEELHYSLGDSALQAGWSILLSSLVSRNDFQFDVWLGSLEKGPLTTDVVILTGATMADLGISLKADDVKVLQAKLSEPDLRGLLGSFVKKLAMIDPVAALKFGSQYRSSIGEGAFSAMVANLQSEEAYNVLSKNIDSSGGIVESKSVIRSMASGWVAINPEAASRWVDSIKDVSIRGEAADAMVKRWAATDIQGAAEWLAATDREGLDSALATFVQSMSRYTPEEAKTWADLIKDADLRKRIQKEIE